MVEFKDYSVRFFLPFSIDSILSTLPTRAKRSLPPSRNVVILNLEQSVSRIWGLISRGNVPDKNFAFVDGFSNASGWLPERLATSQPKSKDFKVATVNNLASSSPASFDSLRTAITEVADPNGPSDVLYIDSISPLLRRNSVESICSFINEMRTGLKTRPQVRFFSIVIQVHEDIHDDLLLKKLEFAATGIIRTVPLVSGTKWLVPVSGAYEIIEKRKNGKVSRYTEYWSRELNNQISFYAEDEAKASEAQSAMEAAAEPNPEEGLSFRIGVSEEERKARENVVLPFTKAQHTGVQSDGVPSVAQAGAAVFIDDDDDAFEGSDPDDDLDL